MDRAEYVALVAGLRLGKRLPEAVYVHREAIRQLPPPLQNLLGDAIAIANLAPSAWDVAKFSCVTPRISLLAYPGFFETAFPALTASCAIDLVSRTATRRDYDEESNRPILHRKETLLPRDHPRVASFAKLTADAERAGLFREPRTIGFSKQWSELLAREGWRVDGHTLVRAHRGVTGTPTVLRHRTAIHRPSLSTPMQALWRHGYLDGSFTLFDYGCGRGGDLNAVREQGIDAAGWDPFFAPNAPLIEADIVNLGFVLNVIEDPRERRTAVEKAYALARRVLVVAVLLGGASAAAKHSPFGDGVLTARNTFQKYFEQAELREYLERALGREPIALGPGIFFVFRTDQEEQRFLARRQIARPRPIPVPRSRVAEAGAPPKPRVKPARRSKWDEHSQLADAFWDTCLSLGRLPGDGEFARDADLRTALGSPATVFRRLRERDGDAGFEQAQRLRMNDVLVYLALNLFERRRSFGALPEREQRDVKAFWGTYGEAQRNATALLFAAGDAERLREACAEAVAEGVGFLDDEHALWLRTSAVGRLPTLLRVFLGCAARLYGDIEAADLVKLHARSAKVTLMTFDDFAEKPIPEMLDRVKIDLRAQRIDFFSYGETHPSPLLYLKSRYIDSTFSNYEQQRALDDRIRALTGLDFAGFGPPRLEFEAALARAGVCVDGFELRAVRSHEKI